MEAFLLLYKDFFPLLNILASPPLSDAFMPPFRLFVNTSVVDIVTTGLLEHVPVQFIVDTFTKGNRLLISIPYCVLHANFNYIYVKHFVPLLPPCNVPQSQVDVNCLHIFYFVTADIDKGVLVGLLRFSSATFSKMNICA